MFSYSTCTARCCIQYSGNISDLDLGYQKLLEQKYGIKSGGNFKNALTFNSTKFNFVEEN